MKILKLTAENLKKLVVVEITPDGNLVQITGKNSAGKTSVLDAIWWALAGAENIQAKPIRKGADKAHIELVLGDGKAVALIVERTFTEKASYLTVKTADGARYPGPQKLIDDILGALTLDPLDFMRADPKRQFTILKSLVPLGIDLEVMAEADKQDYEKRTSLNRGVKEAKAKAAAIHVPEGLQEARVDEAAYLNLIEAAAKENVIRETEIRKRARIASDIEADMVWIRAQRAKVKEIMDEIAKKEALAGQAQNELLAMPDIPDPIDIAVLRSDYDRAREVNRGIDQRDFRAKEEMQAKYLQDAADELTKRMEGRALQRAQALAAAAMPIEGLAFSEDSTVTFNGLPLNQASDAEQLMISTSIAAGLNPKLRVIRIRDGSLLDADNLKRLAEFAEARDYQIWIERCSDDGVGIVMEDGHVRGQKPNPKETAEDVGGAGSRSGEAPAGSNPAANPSTAEAPAPFDQPEGSLL